MYKVYIFIRSGFNWAKYVWDLYAENCKKYTERI